jgi:hypothetical protein
LKIGTSVNAQCGWAANAGGGTGDTEFLTLADFANNTTWPFDGTDGSDTTFALLPAASSLRFVPLSEMPEKDFYGNERTGENVAPGAVK